jgi:hypothetical protein
MSDEPQPHPPQLDYLSPEPPNPKRATFLAFAGFVAGVTLVSAGGCGVFNLAGYYIGGPALPTPPKTWWPAALFFALVVVSFVGAVLAYRSGSRPWFLIGALIGAGLMSLVEGTCFANS